MDFNLFNFAYSSYMEAYFSYMVAYFIEVAYSNYMVAYFNKVEYFNYMLAYSNYMVAYSNYMEAYFIKVEYFNYMVAYFIEVPYSIKLAHMECFLIKDIWLGQFNLHIVNTYLYIKHQLLHFLKVQLGFSNHYFSFIIFISLFLGDINNNMQIMYLIIRYFQRLQEQIQ